MKTQHAEISFWGVYMSMMLGVCFIAPAKARTHLHGRHMGRFLQCFSATLSLGYVQKKKASKRTRTQHVPIYRKNMICPDLPIQG